MNREDFIDVKRVVIKLGTNVLRNELGKQLELIDANDYKFCWIVDFPIALQIFELRNDVVILAGYANGNRF